MIFHTPTSALFPASLPHLIAVSGKLRDVLDVLIPDAGQVAHQVCLWADGGSTAHGPHFGIKVLAALDVVEGSDLHVSKQGHHLQVLTSHKSHELSQQLGNEGKLLHEF